MIQFQGNGHVLIYGAGFQQVELLENHPDVLPDLPKLAVRQLIDDLPLDLHMALRRRLQGVHHAQQGTFPGPAESNDPKDIPLFHFQVHMLEGLDGTAAHLEGLADILELDQLQHLSKKIKEKRFYNKCWGLVDTPVHKTPCLTIK